MFKDIFQTTPFGSASVWLENAPFLELAIFLELKICLKIFKSKIYLINERQSESIEVSPLS